MWLNERGRCEREHSDRGLTCKLQVSNTVAALYERQDAIARRQRSAVADRRYSDNCAKRFFAGRVLPIDHA